VKVPSPISPTQIVRGLIAVSLAWALAAGGIAAPVVASAEEAQPLDPAPASAEASTTASSDASAPLAAVVTKAFSGPTTPVVPARPVVRRKLTVKQIIARTGYAAGLSRAEVDAMLWMAKRESNYHPTSHSRSNCHGLFQLSKGMAHGHAWSDPVWNTKRAIRYMKGRYGGVLRAKAFWVAHHWY
jgi:hypothetical protein